MRDQLNDSQRRSSHAGTSSLDSSCIYALLSFDSSPENEGVSCVNGDGVTVPADRLRPMYCEDGVRVGDIIKSEPKMETVDKGGRNSIGGLMPAVPNQYTNTLTSAGRKKQLVITLPDADASECAEARTSVDSALSLCVRDKLSACNGLKSLLPAGSDNADGDKTQLRDNSAAQSSDQHCPEIGYRRYSCGDQLAATWWRLLDRAASFSDLRGLSRSLTRFCCSTWRTFAGIKSPCIDVSKVGNIDPRQPCTASELDTNGVNGSVGDRNTQQFLNPWWHKPVSPDRRRLIDIGSDVENSSVYEDSPRRTDCRRTSLENAQNLSETVSDGQLSDSDGGGSYVTLKVNCRSGSFHKTPLAEIVPKDHIHFDCGDLVEDDTVLSVVELPTEHTANRHGRSQKWNDDELSPAPNSINCCQSVQVSQSSPSTVVCSAARQTTPCDSTTCSLYSGRRSLSQTDQPHSNNGYINLSVGMHERQSASNGSSLHYGQSAVIFADSVPNLRNDSVVTCDSVAVRAPHSVASDRLSCDSSLSSDEPLTDKFSRRSSSRFLRLLRRSSMKADKQPVLRSTSSAAASESRKSSVGSSTDSVAAAAASCSTSAHSQSPNVRRLPSPDVPPPPVPDDSSTSRLFALCHNSYSEHLPTVSTALALDNGDLLSQYEDLSSVKSSSCAVARKSAALSSSYSAGDKRRCESWSLKSSAHEMVTSGDNARLLAQTLSHRQRHGWFMYFSWQAVRVATQYASAPCKLTISSYLFAR